MDEDVRSLGLKVGICIPQRCTVKDGFQKFPQGFGFDVQEV